MELQIPIDSKLIHSTLHVCFLEIDSIVSYSILPFSSRSIRKDRSPSPNDIIQEILQYTWSRTRSPLHLPLAVSANLALKGDWWPISSLSLILGLLMGLQNKNFI